MRPVIYIDGQSGTTGLQIVDRLSRREDVTLLFIDEGKRHDSAERARLMNESDLVFLCLPDAAAREAVSLVTNPATRIIDASTAHRVAPDWTYGFAELRPGQREEIARSRRVANPGCHATGFIASVAPLTAAGILPRDYPLTCFSLSGYSGGGKKMIADYEAQGRSPLLGSPGIYATRQNHKHLPEMAAVCGLTEPPIFCPVVDDYYKGMATTVMLHSSLLPGHPTAQTVLDALSAHYAGSALVSTEKLGYDGSTIFSNAMAGTDALKLIVCGTDAHITVTALFDNLGKGASGAAVQNMNLMLGLEETAGLSF